MSFNKEIPQEPTGDHAGQVIDMLDQDFQSYLIFGYLKDGRRVLMARGKASVSDDSVNQALNLLRFQLSYEGDGNDEIDTEKDDEE